MLPVEHHWSGTSERGSFDQSMKLSQLLLLSALLTVSGCHTPNGRGEFSAVADWRANVPPSKLALGDPQMATVVACFARPDAKKEDIVQAIISNIGSGVWWRERKLMSDLHNAQSCADSIMHGTKVTFYLEKDPSDSLFWALTAAGAYAQIIK